MSWEDEEAIELLIEEAKSFVSDDPKQMQDAAQAALDAAESLDLKNLNLEFTALFYLSVSYIMQNKFALAFSHAIRVISMSEDPELNFDGNPNFITLAYTCCAISAVELPSVQKEALRISQEGIELCKKMGGNNRLYMSHEHSKLLMANRHYTEATTFAEQLVSERLLASEDEGGCELECYQKVYAESLGFSSSLQTGIEYLDKLLLEDQHSYKLWYARAKLYFKAGDYQAVVSDCRSACLVDTKEGEYPLLLSGLANAMAGNWNDATSNLATLCASKPTNESYAIWYSLISSDMERLKRFTDNDTWESKLIQYLQSNISFGELIKQTNREDNPQSSLGEAYCFSSLQYARWGEKTKAQKGYEQCLKYSHHMDDTYMWANAYLQSIRT